MLQRFPANGTIFNRIAVGFSPASCSWMLIVGYRFGGPPRTGEVCYDAVQSADLVSKLDIAGLPAGDPCKLLTAPFEF